MKSSEDLVSSLFDLVYTTKGLRAISDTLEELSHNKAFKMHTSAIVDDTTLTESQKKRQLSYVLKVVDDPVLLDFFDQLLASKQFWLFKTGKIDYFDTFVQQFQMATEDIGLVYMVTSIELTPPELKEMAVDLSKSFGYKVLIKHEVNPTILGGAQLRVENLVFDFSLKTKFTQFQQAWITSLSSTEKKVGRNQPS